jgi:hypothetical protein
MRLDWTRLFRGTPLLARILEVAEEFLLLGINRDDGGARTQGALDGRMDVPKLRIPIRMVPPFLGLLTPTVE